MGDGILVRVLLLLLVGLLLLFLSARRVSSLGCDGG